MKRKLLTVVMMLWTCSAVGREADKMGQVEVGKALPKIAAFDLEYQARSSEQLLAMEGTRGLLVQFWATWCKPCMEEIDQLIRARKRLSEAGVRVLLVNLLDPYEKVAEVARREGASDFVWIRDRTGAVTDVVGLEEGGKGGLPLAVVADGQGKVRAILRGGNGKYVDLVIEALR